MSQTCLNRTDSVTGRKIKDGYAKAIPGLKALLDRLERVWEISRKKATRAYVQTIDTSPVFTESTHVLLCYMLQSIEKITVSLGVQETMIQLEKAGIPYEPLIIMHDEENFMVPEEYAEQAREIAEKAFTEGPKKLGVMIMEGDAKIGDNWLEVH